MTNMPFTRRDFLKISAAGFLGAWLSELGLDRALAAPPPYGRMTLSGLGLYQDPEFKSKKLHVFGRDEVLKITAEADGESGNIFNHKWYALNGEGYTYSGWVQPVAFNYQKPAFEVRAGGQLGEITVPYAVTRLAPAYWAKTGYRI